jgi:microcompartment protein CcmK/EutM
VLNSDGKAARDVVGDEKTPVRFFVIGLVDD